ncbi:MAG: peptide chain release factor 1 [Parcubacteria group bacterium]|nr:peptide chain release factor 1 [Parcubacteria group bacterium]
MIDIAKMKKEYDKIINELSNPELISDWEKFEELSKKKSYLEKVIDKEEELQSVKNKIEENKTILSAREDAELISLAEEEIKTLSDKKNGLEKDLESLLKINESQNPKSVIIEIRAGTGGDEASLFTASLFRMYSRYALNQGWKQKTLDSHPTKLGGYKEIIFELSGKDVWSKIQYEGGVHRVQRIPATEKNGRIHTSTVSVAVLPKPEKTQITIKPDDIKVDFYRASGPGGQHVNKRETAVRITHLPSNIVVTSQNERNQLQNKENGMKILQARILEKKEMEETDKISSKRKTQIKWAKRAEKIRTYNFPQDRITDHRIKKSWHHLEKIMDGELDQIVSALTKSKI